MGRLCKRSRACSWYTPENCFLLFTRPKTVSFYLELEHADEYEGTFEDSSSSSSSEDEEHAYEDERAEEYVAWS